MDKVSGAKKSHIICSKLISDKLNKLIPDIFYKLEGSEFTMDTFIFKVPNDKDWFSGVSFDPYSKKILHEETPKNITIETKNVSTINSSFSKSISPIEHGNAVIFDTGKKAVIDITLDDTDSVKNILIQQKNVKKK